ncbi:agmatinase family protein [Rubritalea marina]|uniref:agmatinase family protein n=1 Tax=Rubritalea marina TaxID=361055 RepID=UPI001969AF74|nr:agmatinase family protein [Rubritalea marina]
MKTVSALTASLTVSLLSQPLSAAEKFDPKTEKTLIEMLQETPNAVPLDSRDPTLDVRKLRRDPNNNPKREPGPINIQKTVGGLAYMGIPTFFRLPVALGPEDLKAGKVEVAFFGAPIDMSTGQRGTAYGPQAVRTGEIVGGWGEISPLSHPVAGDVDFTKVLNCVDYGDAPVDIFSGERSVLPVYEMAKEIAEAGAIPVTIGGDHSLMYADVAAVTEVHGKGKVAVVHFDAHFDGIPLLFGHYLTHGAPVRRVIDEGHVKGEHFIQIGLNSVKPGAKDLQWMRKNKMKYHFMNEIDEKGWKAVTERVLKELEGGPDKIFISIDTDVLDPVYAPGMGTPEPGGLTVRELFPMLRAVATAKEVVGIELVEVNPVADPTYRSKQVAVRILRETLTGVALRKKGITDPFYVDPEWADHGADAPEKK